MDFIEHARMYFQAEKQTGMVVLALSLVMLAGAAGLWWGLKDDFARGLAGVLLVVGLAALGGGGFLALKTDAQMRELTEQYHQGGAGTLATEGERMEKVVRNFGYYRYIFYAAIIAALALLILLNTQLAIGIAVGLLLFAALGITVDTYAEHRAQVYLEGILELA